MPVFNINQVFRLPPTKIFGAFQVFMLMKTPTYIGSDAGIKRVIGTKNDINRPVHGRSLYNQTTVPNTEPTAAVSPIASAPQKVTRNAPLMRPEPPA